MIRPIQSLVLESVDSERTYASNVMVVAREFILTTERNRQMRIHTKYFIAGLAILTLTMPVWARTYKQSLKTDKSETIGTTQLSAGSYEFAADDAKKELNVLENGKVMATVPGQWVKLPKKIEYSTVLTDGSKIIQIQFSGSDLAFQVQ